MKSLVAAHCSSTKQWWNKHWRVKLYFEKSSSHAMGHTVAQLVKERTIRRKAVGLSTNGVTGIFHWLSLQPHYEVDSAFNINEYKEYFLGVKAADACGWQPDHLHVPTVMKSGSFTFLEPSRPVQACTGIPLPLLYLNYVPPCGGMRWHSGQGTTLQTGRSQVRFPMVSLGFFIDIILPVALWPWGRPSL